MRSDDDLHALSDKECRALLATHRVGRIGLSVGALPAIYPVRYRMDDGGILVCPGGRSDLVAAGHGGVVGFEVDSIDPDGRGWSVLVVGLARRFPAPRSRDARGDGTPAEADCDVLLRIDPALVSGRQVSG